jgi:NAD(P)-dependent dehydrogenase (short-subunit alcohol dehydrogenase family)
MRKDFEMAEKRFAIVTGGTGALGTVVTEVLLREGYQVAVPYTSERNLEPFERQIGDLKAQVTLVRSDLTVESEVQDFIQATLDEFGHIDVLVNTVGGFVGGIPVAEMAEERWNFMMDLNLKSIFLCCKAVLPHMIERKHGKIVNTSARAALSGAAGLGAYSVSKNGVRILTESIAEEVKDLGINVNSLLVSIMDTPANREGMPDEDHSRWVSPDDIAQVILFLISDAAAIINGAAIPVYGRA